MNAPDQPKLRLRDRRRRLMWVKVAAGASVVVISLALIFYAARRPEVTITAIHVSGTHLVQADEVKAIAEQGLQGSYAYLVPYGNSLVAPLSAVHDAIMRSFPPIKSVSISRSGLQALDIQVQERAPVALWCLPAQAGGTDATDTSKPCYLMDADGYVFAHAAATDEYLRYFGPLSGNIIGSTYLDSGFASLDTLVTDIGKSIGHRPLSVTVDATSNDVSVAFADDGILQFVRTAERQATLDNIASVFASQSFRDNKQFEYADFRFGNKVYVKFKGQ